MSCGDEVTKAIGVSAGGPMNWAAIRTRRGVSRSASNKATAPKWQRQRWRRGRAGRRGGTEISRQVRPELTRLGAAQNFFPKSGFRAFVPPIREKSYGRRSFETLAAPMPRHTARLAFSRRSSTFFGFASGAGGGQQERLRGQHSSIGVTKITSAPIHSLGTHEKASGST